MKIRSIILSAAIFALFTAPSFAKENEVLKVSTKTDTAAKKDSREDIHSLDFAKLFNDAEGYFKAAKAWKKLKCEPKSGFICTKHECKKREVKSIVILDKNKKTITRCEDKNCETFPAEFEQTGVFFNIQTNGPVGTLIRILGDNRYKEITTVGLDAYIANGECIVTNDEAK